MEEHYHKRPHDGIAEYYRSLGAEVPEGGIPPLQEFNRDPHPLTYLDVSVVAEAFLHHETRKVDKGACISFRVRKYGTRRALIGCRVEISYDPLAPETVTVHYPGMLPFTAVPLKVGAYCDKSRHYLHACSRRRPQLPACWMPWKRSMRNPKNVWRMPFRLLLTGRRCDGNV